MFQVYILLILANGYFSTIQDESIRICTVLFLSILIGCWAGAIVKEELQNLN